MDFSWFILCYVMLGVLSVCGLWLYYEHRGRDWYERQRARRAYHCIKCGHIYSAPRTVDRAPCPKCGHVNIKLEF